LSKELAAKIRDAGWWQGSVADAATLKTVEPSLPDGPAYWVIASQTCNLFNEDFRKISKVEWIAAHALEDAQRNANLRGGRNPRELETMTQGELGDLWIRCESQERYWGSRARLAEIEPHSALKDDSGKDPEKRYKDTFACWLGRGYTRLELSDELGLALSRGKFVQAIDNLVKAHEGSIFGIFINLNPREEGQELPEHVKPPCEIDMKVVVRNEAALSAVKKKLKELFDDPIVPNVANVGKISRVEALKTEVAVYLVHDAVPASRWTVQDIESSIRYNFNDYLSASNEAGGD